MGTIVVHDDDAAGTGPTRTRSASPSGSCRDPRPADKGRAVRRRSKLSPLTWRSRTADPDHDAVSHRTYRLTRMGARAVTVTAFAAAILIGVEAAARAQEAGGQPVGPGQRSTIPAGVTVSGLRVGGLTAPEAERALADLASRPLTVGYKENSWRYAPQTLGAEPQVESAVQAALAAPAGAALQLDVEVREQKLARWARSFAKGFDRRHRNAEIVLQGQRPDVRPARTGRELSQGEAQLAVRRRSSSTSARSSAPGRRGAPAPR